ncbi:MAG: cyclic nucleotide-binding domain-containing protein [Deltaproteobacteria bacterium]|nr:cyclic nucleotide-binding domain-containing protein [Deltaproteobacteria bacterium]
MSQTTTVSEQQKSTRVPKDLRVMVVDPQPNHRSRIKDILRAMEMVGTISERSSPIGLVDILSRNPMDVVLLDRHTGEMDVFEVIQKAREHPAGKAANFILMGEGLTQNHVQKGKTVGVRGYLPKPFDIARLEKVLIQAAPANTFVDESTPEEAARGHMKDTLDKLRQVTVFGGFSDTELVRLLRIARTKNFPAGTKIFAEGDPGDSMYVIVAGKLEIRKIINGQEKVLVYMKPGDCFGEMAIIEQVPRMADAVAVQDCTVIEVHESVVNNNEDVLSLKLVRQIAILLAKKLRKQSS